MGLKEPVTQGTQLVCVGEGGDSVVSVLFTITNILK